MQLYGSYILSSHKSTTQPKIEEYIQIGKKNEKKNPANVQEMTVLILSKADARKISLPLSQTESLSLLSLPMHFKSSAPETTLTHSSPNSFHACCSSRAFLSTKPKWNMIYSPF